MEPGIVEINFGLRTYDSLVLLKNINNKCGDIELLNIKLSTARSSGSKNKLNLEIIKNVLELGEMVRY